ncbi:MAG TPA: Ig-like domain-containing protein [Gemmatimonadales bacterium]|nr:Ig-like domain-containing protein [Gemmatimonadales bacterium]
MRTVPALIASLCLLPGVACSGGDLGLPEDAIPAGIEPAGGNGQTGLVGTELPKPIVAKVTDAQGRPVPGVTVAFELGAGAEGGATSPDTAITEADGEASAQWVLGEEEGEQRVRAEVVGAGLPVVSFTATAVEEVGSEPSPERSDVTASPETIEVVTGLSVITVRVRDGRGDPVPGAVVTLAVTGTGNVLTQPPAPTGSDGVAIGTLQAIVPETKVISAVVNGVAISETAEVNVTLTRPEPEPGPEAHHLEFIVQPSDTEEGEVISPPVAVGIVDADGEVVPVSGVEIELELILEDDDKGSKELEGERTRGTENGVAVFPDLEVDKEEDGFRLRASARGRPELGSVDSEPFDVED